MGILTDDPAPSRARGGHGNKFVQIYRGMDDSDRQKIRRWVEDDDGELIYGGISHTWRKVREHFDIGYTALENGIHRLRESQWDC